MVQNPHRPPISPPQAPARLSVGTLSYTTGGLIVLFFWLLWGDFAWMLKERSIPTVVQLLLKKFDASDTMTAILSGSLPQALAIVLGPIVSTLSDRHRGRMGRRIPFLLFPTPLAVVAILGLSFCAEIGRQLDQALGAHSPGLNASTLIALSFFWTLFEVTVTVVNSVFGGLINDTVPHSVIGRFYGLFRMLSLMAGILFFYEGLGKAEDHYRVLFFLVGAVYAVGFTLMCLNVREGDYPPPPPRTPATLAGRLRAVVAYVRECFGRSYYLLYFGFSALGWMAFTPTNGFNLFFAKSVNMSMEAYGKYYALTYFCSLVLAYPLGVLADRFHPLRLGIVMFALYAVTTLWGGVFAVNASSFAFAFVAHGVLSGAWMTSVAALGQMLLPKVKYGQYASAGNIVSALGTITTGCLTGEFLDHIHHQYRYAYLISSVLAFTGLLAGVVLYAKFKQFGGTEDYVAPE